MNLSGIPQVSGAEVQSDSTLPLAAIGSLGFDTRGRIYKYVLAGGVNLVTGNALQSPASVGAHAQLTPTVGQPIGSTQLVVTLGAQAATENQYADGLACIDTTPGEGFGYMISGHAAVLSAGVATLNLRKDDEIQVALTTASRVTLMAHPCRGVIQHPAAATGGAVGVAVYPIGAGKYGWVGVCGDFPCLIDGTPAVGMALSVPGTNPGALAINSTTLAIVGRVLLTGVAGKIFPCQVNFL